MDSAPAQRGLSRPLSKRFYRLTFYNILANVTAPLVGLVDVAMLGHLSEIRFLAGVALGGILFDFLYWTAAVLRMGTTGLTAQAIGKIEAGRGDRDEIHLILGRFLLLAGIIGAVLLLFRGALGDLGFAFLSGTPEVEAAGREYYDARILGVPAAIANIVFMGWFLGREESQRVLWMTAIANVANIALNYLFIIELEMAARGAGLASALSQYLMLAIAIWLAARSSRGFRWNASKLLGGERWREMATLNRDILIRTLLLVGSFAVFTNSSSIFGVDVLAANTILLRILTLAAFLIDGAAFATESLGGVLDGGGQRRELRRLLHLALILGVVFALPFVFALLVFPRAILELLTSHASVVETGLLYHAWMVPVLLFGAVAYIYDGLFLGLTAGSALRNAMLTSTLLIFLPIVALAHYRDSVHLLWLALAVYMLARALTLEAARRRLPAFAPSPVEAT